MAADKHELFQELRDYLDITWPDDKGDVTLLGMMNRGIAALGGKIGKCDFLGETPEKTLLFTLVMYERAGELAQFWINYKDEIISLQIDRKVDIYAASEESAI